MPRVEFEPMIPVFERAKTVHALDRAATVIGTTADNNTRHLYEHRKLKLCTRLHVNNILRN
jgi:hypothetical protein